MSKKWTSIVTEIVLAVCSLVFFIMAYNFNDGGTSVYAGAGYYPMLVSGLMALFSITGILTDLFGKEKNSRKTIDISRIQNVGFVITAIAIILIFWQFLGLFYVGAVIGVGMLLILLDPKPKTGKRIGMMLAIAVGMTAVTWLVFEIALKIHV
ncbi:MAG: tripartite tricarboxylate transporter TctB family protein [Clostridia bacterium]|nr:tripartite tricarboxylate transporter TctB family protein [Clostridia bacterium]